MFFVFLSLVSNLVFANPDPAFYQGIVESPTSFAASTQQLNPNFIQVVQWNVYEYNDLVNSPAGCFIETNFCNLLRSSDLLLLQESKSFSGPIRALGDRYLNMNTKYLVFAPYAVNKDEHNRDLLFMSFDEKARRGLIEQEQDHYGSALYSSVQPELTEVRMSENPDQVFEVYMPLIAATYPLSGRSDKLLVINFHNRAMVDASEQLDLLYKAEKIIAGHPGPVLFAGDFNTWTENKVHNVYDLARRQGLLKIHFDSLFDSPFGPRQLDHAFVRGISVVPQSLRVHEATQNFSDHKAISYSLTVL